MNIVPVVFGPELCGRSSSPFSTLLHSTDFRDHWYKGQKCLLYRPAIELRGLEIPPAIQHLHKLRSKKLFKMLKNFNTYPMHLSDMATLVILLLWTKDLDPLGITRWIIG